MKRKVLTMRKILAVLLAVLMITSLLAMLPASAATGTYDGTTKDTEGLNKIIITEIAPNATYHPNGVAESQDETKFPMNFMELYNNNAGDKDLSTLSILRGVNIPKEPDDPNDAYLAGNLWRRWRDKKFISKIDIKAGAIVDEATAKLTGEFDDADPTTPVLDNVIYNFLTNQGQDMTFSNGENVVLWFISADTIEWMKERDSNDSNFKPREAFVKSFYGANASADDYTILMVWAWSDLDVNSAVATDMFALSAVASNANRDYVYGVANNTWDPANDKAYDETAGINENLYSMAVMGTSIYRYNGMQIVDTTATFAVPTTKPYIANAYAQIEINPTTHNNYFDAGLVTSFREVGIIDWASKATPGSMPAWQWAMVDANAYDAFKTGGTLDATKVQAAVDAYLKELKIIDDGAPGREENDDRDYNFQTQEELKNQFFNTNNKGGEGEEDGMPTLVLVLIIVGAVVVAGGAACAVIFLVVLPKKKKAAAAVADAPVADAPVEEAPVEAPAEEEKKDE